MQVVIDPKKRLYLETDKFGYQINKYTGKQDKNGKEMFTTQSYPSSIEQAIRWLLKDKINDSTATTLHELLEDHRKFTKEIHDLFKMEGLK